MSECYEHYQILVEKLQLPEQKQTPKNLIICNLVNKSEYNEVLSLFFKIFPDEVDSDKATELRDLQTPQFEGNFLARISGKIIGFLVSGIINQVGYISYLGIDENHRGQGVATALLNQFKLYLMKYNVQKIRCTIRKDNKKTLGYIHFLGFQLL